MNNGMNPPELYDKDKVAYNCGLAIHKMRKEKGMTQDQVAEMSGVCKTIISKIENGAVDAKLKEVIGICNALDVTIEDLVEICEVETNFAWVEEN